MNTVELRRILSFVWANIFIFSKIYPLLFQRLTIWANCPMNLQKFPLDSQVYYISLGEGI